MSWVLGLDIGATHSRAQLCVDGEVVADAAAAGASLVAVGAASATAALDELLAQLPLRPRRLDVICAGSAGASAPGTRQFLTEHLVPLTRSGNVVIVRDAMLVLPAAGLDAGVALISGTGSVAVGRFQGAEAQAGGWGYLLGDEGSGYWVVRAALQVLLDRRDSGLPPGELGDRLLAATGTGEVSALHELFYRQPHPRRWAGYAPLILSSADPAAARITAAAAEALAGLAMSAAERLAAPVSLPVVLAGGMFGDGALEAAVRTLIGNARPGSDVRTLAQPPVTGAVRLAQAAASGRDGHG
jgi:N-acetylglucosamine kinase-like BadF-type ATPase